MMMMMMNNVVAQRAPGSGKRASVIAPNAMISHEGPQWNCVACTGSHSVEQTAICHTHTSSWSCKQPQWNREQLCSTEIGDAVNLIFWMTNPGIDVGPGPGQKLSWMPSVSQTPYKRSYT